MKILAIMGSPRKKGNTFQAVERVRDILCSMDSRINFEYVFLADCHLDMCKGCFTCFARGEDKCPLKDGRDSIMAKLMDADGIILAAPTYAMGVPALMKNFIDRFAYTLHRPCFFDKVFLAVTTIGGVMGMKQALGQLALLGAGSKKTYRLGVPMPPISMPMPEKKASKKLKKTAAAFYKSAQKTKRHMPGVADFAYFGAFKSMSRMEGYKKACPADVAYYEDKDTYFYPIKGHAVRLFWGRLLTGMMRLSFKMIVKDNAAKAQPDKKSI